MLFQEIQLLNVSDLHPPLPPTSSTHPSLSPIFSLNPSFHPILHQFKSNPSNKSIRETLAAFYESRKVPHLIFHGTSGSGKLSLVMDFINLIYQNDKNNIKKNVMVVNCSHGKGIKFIREDLKFFAKTNIQANQGIPFKTILLINAHHLTIDAQSALRRCIEVFSYNTRFFIVVEDKNKLLNPIVSRFCDIYVPEVIDENNGIVHLGKPSNISQPEHLKYLHEKMSAFSAKVSRENNDITELSTDLYEKGLCALDVIEWINTYSGMGNLKERMDNPDNIDNDSAKYSINMDFYRVKSELRSEKLLICQLLVIYMESL